MQSDSFYRRYQYFLNNRIPVFYPCLVLGHLYKLHNAHKHTQKKSLISSKVIFDKSVYRGAH
jgi:hypothetical protein